MILFLFFAYRDLVVFLLISILRLFEDQLYSSTSLKCTILIAIIIVLCLISVNIIVPYLNNFHA